MITPYFLCFFLNVFFEMSKRPISFCFYVWETKNPRRFAAGPRRWPTSTTSTSKEPAVANAPAAPAMSSWRRWVGGLRVGERWVKNLRFFGVFFCGSDSFLVVLTVLSGGDCGFQWLFGAA